MNKKHADVIRAWLNGAEVQFYNTDLGVWVDVKDPSFISYFDYRPRTDNFFVIAKKRGWR